MTPAVIHKANATEKNNKPLDTIKLNGKRFSFSSIVYFVFKRNIYTWTFVIDNYRSAKLKAFNKLVFLIFFELLISNVLLAFAGDIDFTIIPTYSYNNIASYIFITIFGANLALALLSYLLNSNVSKLDALPVLNSNEEIETNSVKTKSSNFWDIAKVISCVFINIVVWLLLFYITTMFCAVWSLWGPTLLLIWLFVLVGDFLIFEIIFELIIESLSNCRNNKVLEYCFNKLLYVRLLRTASN